MVINIKSNKIIWKKLRRKKLLSVENYRLAVTLTYKRAGECRLNGTTAPAQPGRRTPGGRVHKATRLSGHSSPKLPVLLLREGRDAVSSSWKFKLIGVEVKRWISQVVVELIKMLEYESKE